MKWFYTLCLTSLFILITQQSLAANQDRTLTQNFTIQGDGATTSRCEVDTGDVGVIIGKGHDSLQARENASEICFERRLALFQVAGRNVPGEEQSLDIIDSCVNISCRR